jgi:hypothetical protein
MGTRDIQLETLTKLWLERKNAALKLPESEAKITLLKLIEEERVYLGIPEEA